VGESLGKGDFRKPDAEAATSLTGSSYWLTRILVLRLLGVVYLCAFLVAALQGPALIGPQGILPADDFLRRVQAHLEAGGGSAFFNLPTVFWWTGFSARTLAVVAWSGAALSVLLAAGFTNAIALFVLWALYSSIVNVGQLFWGYGWEILTLEAGFLAIFLAPLLDPRPLAPRTPPPRVVLWLFWWLTFRVMFGAGLIKLRGDPCWTDLTCLAYHYETQPIPNPLSWYFHHAPLWFHKGGVLCNHFAELVAPAMLFGPRKTRLAGATTIVAFQGILILSGNLSWLNWLTIAVAVAAFDDAFLSRCFMRGTRERAQALAAASRSSMARSIVVGVLAVLVGYLSIDPVLNMFSPRQVMNTSFDPLHLVNTYGAFGTVGRERDEIVLSGTIEEQIGPDTVWLEYEFRCKPGHPRRRPCIVSPYHERIDWQMWFAAMSVIQREPWLVRFIQKLLDGDSLASGLLARDPFRGQAPHYIKADLYRYEFTDGGDAWWRRTFVRQYLPPVAKRAAR
jgi:hypothetical protein